MSWQKCAFIEANDWAHIDTVKLLTPLSRRLNHVGDDGPLMNAAAVHGRLEIVKYFAGLKASKDFINEVNEEGGTPIHSAAEFGYLDIVKFLVPLSENTNYPNKNGETPIDLARKNKHENIVTFLENCYKKQ